jgi:predicted esterase YcpF (UPF0227 family)
LGLRWAGFTPLRWPSRPVVAGRCCSTLPSTDLARYIGEQTHWHDPQDRFYFKPEYVQQLQDLTLTGLKHPERYLVLIAKGDEVLNWREMHARYADTQLRLLEGGDHALSDFDLHLPAVMDFLSLGQATS